MMDRLTTRLQDGTPVMAWRLENKYSTEQWIDMLEERVAAYEATHMTPSDVMSMRMDMAILTSLFSGIEVDRVRELVAADKAGRVVVMPCKIGDKLYRVFGGEILESQVQNMRYLALLGRWDIDTIPFTAYAGSAMGATIFSTREEAEAHRNKCKEG